MKPFEVGQAIEVRKCLTQQQLTAYRILDDIRGCKGFIKRIRAEDILIEITDSTRHKIVTWAVLPEFIHQTTDANI